MNLRSLLLALFVFLVAFSSCKKDPITEVIHQNKVIDSNKVPPYSGVSTIQMENFINKTYIDLIGQEPTSQELTQEADALKASNLDSSSRVAMVQGLQGRQEYFAQYWDIASANNLEGVTIPQVQQQIQQFVSIQLLLLQQGDTLSAQVLQLEVNRLSDLRTARDDYKAGSIDLPTFYARFIFNYFFDQINMGSENFVLASFENLLGRSPTTVELDNGVTMVDGQPSELFLVDGTSKLDYVTILTTSEEFYEQLVEDTYQNLLVRKPTSAELGTATIELVQTGDLKPLQQNLIKSDEYAGF